MQRLTQVINPQGERTSYSYDAAGRRTVKKLANGSRTSFSYNAANRITSVAHLKSDASLQAKYEYKHDKAGNRTAMAETGATTARTTWSYDAAYQLTAEHRTGSNAYRNTYVYDNRGNRTLKNLDGQRTTSTYDAANQLAWSQDASGRTTYTFDADGNQQVVLSPGGDRVTNLWDYENKLIGVQHPAGSRETMAYDPDGKRVMLQESASTTKYVWDNQNYLQETNASDVTQVTYTNEPRTYGNLISQRKAGASHYYLFDALGSTRLLTDASENISESLLYDAWGNLVGSAPTMAVPFRWVGELGYLFVLSTADYSVRARVYQPGIGRWISQDPIGFVDGLNLYAYVQNQTGMAFDASGFGLITDLGPLTHDDIFGPISPALGSADLDERLKAIGTRLRLALTRFHTHVVVKSFIVGPIIPGTIHLRFPRPATDLAASRRLWSLASRVSRLPAFNQDPRTDAMDGEYRLFTMANVTYMCDCDDRPRDLEWSKADDGGLEFAHRDKYHPCSPSQHLRTDVF